MIQQTLEETGLYKVMLVDSDQEALLCIQTVSFTIAILDFDLSGADMLALASSMRQRLPKMRQVIICALDDPVYQFVIKLQPAGLLSKPFDMPVLLDSITKAIHTPLEPVRIAADRPASTPAQPVRFSTPPVPEWLQDASWAAGQLTRLSLESAAQAALIVRDNSLWAYAGELSQLAAQELADNLASFWDVHPASLTHSTRTRCGDMVRFIRLESTDGEYMLYATSLGQGMLLSLVFDSDTPFSTIRTQASYLAKVLATPPGAQPPPSPVSRSVPAPAFLVTDHAVEHNVSAPPASLPPLLEDVPPPLPLQTRQIKPTAELSTPYPEENGKPGMPTDLLPPTPALHYLTYNCTLIPRLPQHKLTGDLAQRLQLWMPQLFLAFGWQLLNIGIYPEYLQIFARLTPNTSPGALIRTIRQQTSRRILSTFPHLAEENPSNDFWAPGYLILSNPQTPPDHIIQEFIEQTRQQQGTTINQ
jgi:REP element-mobilizing transposase RayT